MGGRLLRFLAVAALMCPAVATIGAPDLDGLSRAISKLFRESPPESSGTLASASIDFFNPEDTGDAFEPARLTFHDLPAAPRRPAPLFFQSRPTDTPLAVQPAVERGAPRGALMTSLYVSFAALQALDAHSTIRALDRGARESNPMIAPFADNTGALIALKAGTAAGVIYMTDRVRRHNRLASIVIMAAANSAYATIVARNYRIVASQPAK
jgi:hypothetical protein